MRKPRNSTIATDFAKNQISNSLRYNLSTYYRYIVLFLLLFHSSIFSQTQEKQQLPNPTALESNWWEYFQGNETLLNQKIETLEKSLQKIPSSLPAELQKDAKNLIEQIQANLLAWSKLSREPLPTPKAANPFKESYSIDDLVQLLKLQQKHEVDLQAKKEERGTLKQQTGELRQRLDAIWKDYLAAAPRSPDKAITGLTILSLRPSLEVNLRKIKINERGQEVEARTLADIKEEIEVAKKRLGSKQEELSTLTRRTDSAKRIWDNTKRDLQRNEIFFSEHQSKEGTEEAETKNQLLQLQLIDSALKESQAHSTFIKEELIYLISLLIVDPGSPEFKTHKVEAQEPIALFKTNLKEWRVQTERILRRAGQLLSLKEKKGGVDGSHLNQIIHLAQSIILNAQLFKEEIEETQFLLKTFEEKSLVLQASGDQWFKGVIDFFVSAWSGTSILGKTLFYMDEKPITVFNIFQFLLILVVTWWISKLVRTALNTLASRRKGIRKAVVYRLNRLIHYFILIIGGLFGLTWIGFDFSSLVLVAGALGVGIGFGLQNIFNDFIAGVIILFQSHLKVGDFIEIGPDLRGEVREINVRSTIITTNDGIDILIPNSEMVRNKIANWTLRDPYRRVHVSFSVAYGTDIDELSRLIVETAKKVPCTLQKIGVREPKVRLSKMGDNGLDMELVVWVDEKWTRQYHNTRSMYLLAIEKTLKKHGIEIPFPQLDLHFRTPPEEKKKN